MLKFYLEDQRQQQLNKDNELILKLIDIALPCCENNKFGENLFFNNCLPCHSLYNYKTIGPSLTYSTSKYSEQWLYQWTTDSEKLIKSGDSLAVKIHNEYGHLAQPKFNLSEDEVKSIFKFIDKMNQKE
jgi:cytochrome c551/c552